MRHKHKQKHNHKDVHACNITQEKQLTQAQWASGVFKLAVEVDKTGE